VPCRKSSYSSHNYHRAPLKNILQQLVTSAGFGNCVAVSQGAAAAGAGAGAAAGGKKAKRAVVSVFLAKSHISLVLI